MNFAAPRSLRLIAGIDSSRAEVSHSDGTAANRAPARSGRWNHLLLIDAEYTATIVQKRMAAAVFAPLVLQHGTAGAGFIRRGVAM